jgi:hypothetical protein
METPIGSIMRAVAVLLTHMLRRADARRKPTVVDRGFVQTASRRPTAAVSYAVGSSPSGAGTKRRTTNRPAPPMSPSRRRSVPEIGTHERARGSARRR